MRPGFLDEPALRAVLAALPGSRVVGGAVRDAIAGREVADIDVATPWMPEAVAAALAQAGHKALPTGLGHGTVTAIAQGRPFEVTTLRRDVETDGRHAVVAFTDDWREDAARRDFTINAMSMNPDGEVFDYFAGLADLGAGAVRFVGDPAARIAEDYLRVLRFFRFWARYGRGAPDPAAVTAISAGIAGLAQLSPERVWSEIKRILAGPDPWPTLQLMGESGVLGAVLPGAIVPPTPPALPAEPVLRLAALGPASVAGLRLSSAEQDRLTALRAAPALPQWAGQAEIRRALADTPAEILVGRALLAGRDPETILASETPVFPLRGRDLIAAGVPPGPALGELLGELRRWWLEQGCVGDVGGELARRLAP